MVEFIHNIYQLYSVSDLIGPSSGASFKAVWADWYVVIHVLFDASGRYGVEVQLDTQCSFMVEFIHNIYQLYSVSDLIGPSSGASFKLYERIGKW
jgi:hypothetical protein